ncbi:MAG: biopolymer transporter ExbD [Pseudomonadota bacterium]
MKRRWRKLRQHDPVELNITAFMNLMVILVPFLLITAVFSRLAILELNLPGGEGSGDAPLQALELEVTIRDTRIEVADRQTGPLHTVPALDDGHDFDALNEYLKNVKANFPDKTNVTVLLEPDIAYDTLVQVMDAVRMTRYATAGDVINAELFPDISIGDAAPSPAITASN